MIAEASRQVGPVRRGAGGTRCFRKSIRIAVAFQDEAAVKQILGIPDDVATYCIIPVGYPLGRWGEAVRKTGRG